jgi:hypothetical protein
MPAMRRVSKYLAKLSQARQISRLHRGTFGPTRNSALRIQTPQCRGLEPSGVAEPGGISDRRRQVIRANTPTSAADAWCEASRMHAALQTQTETVDPTRSCKQENRCSHRITRQTETLDPTRSCKQENRIFVFIGLRCRLKHSTPQDPVNKKIGFSCLQGYAAD